MTELIFARLDKNLAKQLREYADRNSNGMVSVVARRALKLFLDEETLK